MVSVEDKIAALDDMSSSDLRDHWRRLTASPVPRVSPKMLRLALAYEIKAQAFGGLSRETKGNTRYRYYVSRDLQQTRSTTGMRIPASEIETAVCSRIAAMFADGLALAARAGPVVQPGDIAALIARCDALAAAINRRAPAVIGPILQQVRVHDGRIEIVCDAGATAAALKVELDADAPSIITLLSDVRLTGSGRTMRLVQASGARVEPTGDGSLIRLLIKGRKWWGELREGELDITSLAKQEGVTASYLTRIVRLAFLSPAAVGAILAGTVRAGIAAVTLRASDGFSPSLSEQARSILPLL